MIFTQLKNKWKSKQQPIFKTNWKSNSKRNNIYPSTHCNALYLKIYFSFFLEVLSIFFHGLLFLWFFYVYLFINISHLINVSSHNFEVQSSVFSGIINIIFENKEKVVYWLDICWKIINSWNANFSRYFWNL